MWLRSDQLKPAPGYNRRSDFNFEFDSIAATASRSLAMPVHRAKPDAERKKLSDVILKQPPRMTACEKRLARVWSEDDGLGPKEIGRRLHRHHGPISRLLAGPLQSAPQGPGQPRKLSKEKIDKIVKLTDDMIDAADTEYEVTAKSVLRRSRLKVCLRTFCNALHERGYWFHKLREKPILTPADVIARFLFARKYRHKVASWWLKKIQVHLDNHTFKCPTTAAARKMLGSSRVRGVYRLGKLSLKRGCTKGTSTGLKQGRVKASRKLRQNTGARGVLIAGGVSPKSALVWYALPPRAAWGGETASEWYRNVVAAQLKAENPRRRSFTILEDNDPVGNYSHLGIAAKKACRLGVFTIPKRSPELNVMDYAIWGEVERRLRGQGHNFPAGKRASRDQYIKRLTRTAKNLPEEFLSKAISDMVRRCQLLYEAKGGLFEEGGRQRGGRTRRPV